MSLLLPAASGDDGGVVIGDDPLATLTSDADDIVTNPVRRPIVAGWRTSTELASSSGGSAGRGLQPGREAGQEGG